MAFIDFKAEKAVVPVPGPSPSGPPEAVSATKRLTITIGMPSLGAVLKGLNLLVLTGALVWAGWHWWNPSPGPHPGPVPPGPLPAPSDGVALGRAFAPQLCDSLAQGFEALAAGVSATKPLSAANADLKATFEQTRNAAFAATCAPSFAAIVPEGSEPATAEARAAYVQLSRDFARGLRQAK